MAACRRLRREKRSGGPAFAPRERLLETVFKTTFTKPLPAGAETFIRKGERFARWNDRMSKNRTAPLTIGKDGSQRITLESTFYFARYRDGTGVIQTVPTGYRDETAARRVLADLERRAELV